MGHLYHGYVSHNQRTLVVMNAMTGDLSDQVRPINCFSVVFVDFSERNMDEIYGFMGIFAGQFS